MVRARITSNKTAIKSAIGWRLDTKSLGWLARFGVGVFSNIVLSTLLLYCTIYFLDS